MSKHKQPGGIWTAQYAHCAVEGIPHLLTMSAKRRQKYVQKVFARILGRGKDENLKQKAVEDGWVDMKFTISSASGRHPSPLLAAAHS